MYNSIEWQVLREILALLPDETVNRLKAALAGDLDKYICLIEAVDAAGEEKNDGQIGEDWRTFARQSGDRFTQLMERYVVRYQEEERKAGRKGTLSELKETVSNHSKWHRMMRDHGVGNQYREDMRRVCLAFRLSYLEATELLWSAGQPFDPESQRDFCIADCIARRVYEPELVDRELEKHRLPPLFQS